MPLRSGLAGSRMKRSIIAGSGISACMLVASSSRWSFSTITRPMLGMNGNGCAGSIASGVSTGNTRSMNQWSSQSRSASDRSMVWHSSTPASASSRRRSRQTRCCSSIRPCARAWIRLQLLARRPPVGAQRRHPRLGLPDQPGHAHAEEFVEVAGADRQEPQPLQQRMALVLRLLHDPVIEVEPGQLAIDEPVRAVRRHDRGFGRRQFPDGAYLRHREPSIIGSSRNSPASARAASARVTVPRAASCAWSSRATASRTAAPVRGSRVSIQACTSGATGSCRSASNRASSEARNASSAAPISTAVVARNRLCRSASPVAIRPGGREAVSRTG